MLTLYSKETTSFSTLGIGVLRDFISHPLITEELNGAYTLEFEYAKDGYLSEYLIEQNIIKANGQAFRIWNIKKDMQKITVLAKHIFFDLSFNFLADVFPTNLTAQSALAWMLNRAAVATNFSATGNCTQTASTRYVRKNFIDAVFNEDNALLKKFGGELSYDNFNITVHEHRGTNANFSIRYKKNLTGIDFNLDFSNVATRIVPIGFDGLTIDSTYVESSRASNYFTPLYKTYEFSDIKYDPDDEEAYHTLAEAKQALINAANDLFTKNVDLPQVSISVNFVELSKCSEYANYSNLETVHLGDTIDVIIPELNIHTSARVNKTVYDCILDRFITLEIGSAKQSITRSQIVIENQIRKSENYLTQAQQNAENLINHPFNGNVYIDKENGVIYLMDSTSPETAQNVWKWSLGGLGFSSTGINGTYTVAILQDGRINADFITTGQLDTGVIQGYDSLLIQVDTLDREFQKEINPTDTSSGSSITLEDSAETELIDFELEGKTTQATRSGKNLYNVFDKNNTFTTDSDGWITINVNNSGGSSTVFSNFYVNKSNLLTTSTDYALMIEIKSVSGSGVLVLSENDNAFQFETNSTIATTSLTANSVLKRIIRTKSDYTSANRMIKNYVYVSAGSSCSIVLRLSVLADTSITTDNFVYEPYGVMPSPDYPSDLVSVGTYNSETGKYGIEVISTGKNLLSSDFTQASANTIATEINNFPAGTYTLSYNIATAPTQTQVKIKQDNQWVQLKSVINVKSLTFTLDNTYDIRFETWRSNGNPLANYSNFMLEKGLTVTAYEPYQSNTQLYVLDSPLRGIGNYKDRLYIENGYLYVERKIETITYVGSNDESWGLLSGTHKFYINLNRSLNNYYKMYSNYYTYISSGQGSLNDGEFTNIGGLGTYLWFRNDNCSDVNAFKTWLSTHNTNVCLPLETPYTEELGQVQMPSTYQGITYINITDELEPNMSITYVRDTLIANYVESYVREIKITENGIESRVQNIEESDYGGQISAVEERTTSTEKNIEVISTNIDTTTGEVRKVTTTNGMTFDENGLNIHTNLSTFNAQHTYDGTYYRDGEEVITETTINGFKATNLKNKGQHEYSYDDTHDLYEFIDERIEVDGEYCYATFYNGEE